MSVLATLLAAVAAHGQQPPAVVRPNPVPPGEYLINGVVQERQGTLYHLREKASIESSDFLLEADEIDYNEELGIAEARGHVHFLNFALGEEIWADRVEYSFKDKRGSFYKVKGSSPAKIDPRPGILTTGNPFVFQGDWAEKIDSKYLLYRGTITNCTLPDPAWRLDAPKFDIIPGDRALAYKSIFRLRGIPLLYTPVFYKSLSNETRRSGFLTPNIGNSNRFGFMFGAGYYWAINRSYDATYRAQYFTQRGFAHTVDFRGKPTQQSDFDFYLYGVDDKGELQPDGSRIKKGGYLIRTNGQNTWGKGFYSRGQFNYLSSFKFRRTFTESFRETVETEVNSTLNTSKDWSYYHFNAVYTQQDNFWSEEDGDVITIRKLPQFEFISRDQNLVSEKSPLPLWVSWNTSAGLVRRTQPLFQTRRFVERLDFAPRVGTSLFWKGISLSPWFSVRETHYGSSLDQSGNVVGDGYNRFSREAGAELALPSLSRIFTAPAWTKAAQLKHSIETRADFRYVTGIDDFARAIRFDEMEILSNTSEVEVSVANRIWAKNRSGDVRDFMTWEVSQSRFFDPDFGGALITNQRNVLTSSTQLTAYTFLGEPRHYSPIVSSLRIMPRPNIGVDWRNDYDPLRGKFTNSSLSLSGRLDKYSFLAGHNKVSCVPLYREGDTVNPCNQPINGAQVLSPPSNQLSFRVAMNQTSRRGWDAGVETMYDYTAKTFPYANIQITYNTSCCAYSIQYRRIAVGSRNENQYRFAFVIANIGSFGTLRRQEQMF